MSGEHRHRSRGCSRGPSVYIIGTGPGDPTSSRSRPRVSAQRGRGDPLCPLSPKLLRHARVGAELINVGNAAPQPIAQEAISYLLAEKAREGKTVARLKWGDPFVFDRGGEQALFLHEQGVRFDVVPGLPAGIGVPAYAGIPVTYHGGGDTLTLVRGYEDESRTPPHVDWSSLARPNHDRALRRSSGRPPASGRLYKPAEPGVRLA